MTYTEFGDQRKLMDELSEEITNLKPVKSDSLSRCAATCTVLGFVKNVEQNGYAVTNSSEAPFVMFKLLSKLNSKDNVQFGHEMHRIKRTRTFWI